MVQTIIFSDLDGTLLHPRTYSFEKAREALDLIRELEVPLILVSSKTRAEIEIWRERLDNRHPFISENGGGIFIPRGYFPFPLGGSAVGTYEVITLGVPYEAVRRRFTKLRTELGAAVRGFGDMSVDEVRDLTGLPREEAELAMRRDFDEPFIFERKTDERFLQAIEGTGLRWTRGRLFHIMGDHHKGRAVTMLSRLYERRFGPLTTIGLGDNLNDLPFLLTVDRPVLVRKLSGLLEGKVNIPRLVRTEGVGPQGWNEAVLKLLGTTASRQGS
jgi:mannosyl-3-phosphoglycerate phosphatase